MSTNRLEGPSVENSSQKVVVISKNDRKIVIKRKQQQPQNDEDHSSSADVDRGSSLLDERKPAAAPNISTNPIGESTSSKFSSNQSGGEPARKFSSTNQNEPTRKISTNQNEPTVGTSSVQQKLSGLERLKALNFSAAKRDVKIFTKSTSVVKKSKKKDAQKPGAFTAKPVFKPVLSEKPVFHHPVPATEKPISAEQEHIERLIANSFGDEKPTTGADQKNPNFIGFIPKFAKRPENFEKNQPPANFAAEKFAQKFYQMPPFFRGRQQHPFQGTFSRSSLAYRAQFMKKSEPFLSHEGPRMPFAGPPRRPINLPPHHQAMLDSLPQMRNPVVTMATANPMYATTPTVSAPVPVWQNSQNAAAYYSSNAFSADSSSSFIAEPNFAGGFHYSSPSPNMEPLLDELDQGKLENLQDLSESDLNSLSILGLKNTIEDLFDLNDDLVYRSGRLAHQIKLMKNALENCPKRDLSIEEIEDLIKTKEEEERKKINENSKKSTLKREPTATNSKEILPFQSSICENKFLKTLYKSISDQAEARRRALCFDATMTAIDQKVDPIEPKNSDPFQYMAMSKIFFAGMASGMVEKIKCQSSELESETKNQ